MGAGDINDLIKMSLNKLGEDPWFAELRAAELARQDEAVRARQARLLALLKVADPSPDAIVEES